MKSNHPLRLSAVGLILVLAFIPARPAFGQSANDGFDPDANNTVYAIAVQPDGKIIIGGQFNIVGGAPRSRLARLNADGTLDTAFDTGAEFAVLSLAIQADGKILVGGTL